MPTKTSIHTYFSDDQEKALMIEALITFTGEDMRARLKDLDYQGYIPHWPSATIDDLCQFAIWFLQGFLAQTSDYRERDVDRLVDAIIITAMVVDKVKDEIWTQSTPHESDLN